MFFTKNIGKVKSSTAEGAYIAAKKYAIKEQLPFSMTFQEYRDLAVQPCWKCSGTTPGYQTNMLRVINKPTGFTKDNVITLCWPCSRKMWQKFERGQVEPKAVTPATASIQQAGAPHVGLPLSPTASEVITTTLSQERLMRLPTYTRSLRYKRSQLRNVARTSNIQFKMSEIEFSEQLCKDCEDCGKRGKERTLSNGIIVDWCDLAMVDIREGYTVDNTYPLCPKCHKERYTRQAKSRQK